MKKQVYCALAASCFILAGCGETKSGDGTVTLKKVNDAEMMVLHTADVDKTVATVPLSELIESCELVRMDTAQEAYYKPWSTTVSDHYIGIRQSSGAPYKLFDKNGKYLRDIGKKGSGPGEYSIALYQDYIDEASSRIYLVPFANAQAVLNYDLEGNYQGGIPLAYPLNKGKIFFTKDKNIAAVTQVFPTDKSCAFVQTPQGELLKEIPAPADLVVTEYENELFAWCNIPEISVFFTNKDTLFHYDTDQNKLLPYFTADFGTEEKPMHQYNEYPNHIITLTYGKGVYLTDKKKLTTRKVKFVNDFFGGFEVFFFASNGYYIYNVDPMVFKEVIEKRLAESDVTQQDKKLLQDLYDSIGDNDNNLLFYGKLKQ